MKTVSIEVRPGEPDDAAAISRAHRESWLQAYKGLIPHRALMQMVNRRDEKWWRRATRGPATLMVVDIEGTIAGYATMGLNRARALPQEGEVYELYLRPEYQGMGLGRILFAEARSLLRSLGCKGLVAWCLEDSHHADSFFRAAGGRDIAEGMEDFDNALLKKIGYVWD